MKLKLLTFIVAFIMISLFESSISAIEIKFPGEQGFFIGKPMIYVVKATAGDPQAIGSEGIYKFGPDKVTIDGSEYYDCIFANERGGAHFYLGIDSINALVTQKGIAFGETNLNIKPAITALKYPLVEGKKWEEKTKITAKNITIPGLGIIPNELTIDNVSAQTIVSSTSIKVPAGPFDCLLVEATYNGSLLGLPVTLIQRTWMSEDNVPIKRNFEFTKPTKMMLYDMELSEANPDPYDLNWDGISNILDLMIITKYYGRQMQSTRIPNPDINGDGFVDMKDINLAISHFGEKYKKQ
ncbi:MAG: dockerin type I domain-containing protein [Candidatus Poribacteria bacterium]